MGKPEIDQERIFILGQLSALEVALAATAVELPVVVVASVAAVASPAAR